MDALRAAAALEREFARKGWRVLSPADSSASTIVELPKAEIMELSNRPEVQIIYLEETDAVPE